MVIQFTKHASHRATERTKNWIKYHQELLRIFLSKYDLPEKPKRVQIGKYVYVVSKKKGKWNACKVITMWLIDSF